MRKKLPPKIVQVHLRLFREDVEELKRRALAEFVPWQSKLRALVHAALLRRGEIE